MLTENWNKSAMIYAYGRLKKSAMIYANTLKQGWYNMLMESWNNGAMIYANGKLKQECYDIC